eukprot:gnl/TRDRNA2_/TRDRNA2_148615_c0_seq1.p1 gnl/TRDRNA2_/TRDRNA2_148615_c0~~gnl/TRDRNA2_/TRDRNA2_148615_c0_seq1.p1  ORF type:complete len:348 (+),score=44.40 gnl/TRDRNA2_/TRDRNA2_148615_c0_seq1:113-1156(+)
MGHYEHLQDSESGCDRDALRLVTERERARRLVDRLGRDDSEAAELARERRAHYLSVAFRNAMDRGLLLVLWDPDVRQTGCAAAIVHLEARLARVQAGILVSLFSQEVEDKLHQLRSASAAGKCGNSVMGPAIPGGIVHAGRQCAAEPIAPDMPTAAQNLQRACEQITVKSIIDFCIVGKGNRTIEAIATAVVCMIANVDDTVVVSIYNLNPDVPWPWALEIMGRPGQPGQVINSIRRFPSVTEAGRVPEENIFAAQHYLGMADASRAFHKEIHPAVVILLRWIEQAVVYWNWGQKSLCEVLRNDTRGEHCKYGEDSEGHQRVGPCFAPKDRPNRSHFSCWVVHDVLG